ncbi:YybH family protein [Acidobacteriota bacterium]
MRRWLGRGWVACLVIVFVPLTAFSQSGDQSAEIKEKAGDIKQIRLALLDWRDAWESKDLDRYVAAYSKTFRYKGMSIPGFKTYKKTVFDNAGFINVDLTKVTISVENGTAIVQFIQKYATADSGDVGKKTLKFVKEGGGWKIKEEVWAKIGS